jgi:hypothetical protein
MIFYNILNFDKFYRTQSSKFLNLVLTKNIEINYSFLKKYFNLFQVFENFKYEQTVFRKPVKLVPTGFHKKSAGF